MSSLSDVTLSVCSVSAGGNRVIRPSALSATSGCREPSWVDTQSAGHVDSENSKQTSHPTHQQQLLPLHHLSSSMETSYTLTSRPNDEG